MMANWNNIHSHLTWCKRKYNTKHLTWKPPEFCSKKRNAAFKLTRAVVLVAHTTFKAMDMHFEQQQNTPNENTFKNYCEQTRIFCRIEKIIMVDQTSFASSLLLPLSRFASVFFFSLAHCAKTCSFFFSASMWMRHLREFAIEKRAIKSTESTISLENLLLFQLQYNAYWHKFMLRQPTKSANLWFVLASPCSLFASLSFSDSGAFCFVLFH